MVSEVPKAPAAAPGPMAITAMLDPVKIHEFMMHVGVKKAHLKINKMILMGLMSGFYVIIGAHGLVSMLISPDGSAITPPVTFLAGLVFALALMGIIMAGGELFTGNCLLIVAVLSKRIKWWEMVYDLFVVYFSNFFGSIIFSVLLFGTGFYGWSYEEHTPHAATLCKLVAKKTAPRAFEIFFRGIFANFAVCLAVLLSWSSTTPTGKLLGMAWPIAVFVLSGYEHSIANQGLFALSTIVDCPTTQGRYWLNLLMSTLGNMAGAFILGVMYFFISLYGTDHCLEEHPTYAADGVTIVKAAELTSVASCPAALSSNASQSCAYPRKAGSPVCQTPCGMRKTCSARAERPGQRSALTVDCGPEGVPVSTTQFASRGLSSIIGRVKSQRSLCAGEGSMRELRPITECGPNPSSGCCFANDESDAAEGSKFLDPSPSHEPQ